jgi:hypothetical protein
MELKKYFWNNGTMEYGVKEKRFSHNSSIPTFQH